MPADYLAIVKDALSEVLERPVQSLTETTRIDQEFDLDSILFVQFLLSLEDRIPYLRFEPSALTEASLSEVGELIGFIEGAVGRGENV